MTSANDTQVKVNGITQIGLVVRNVQRTIENYWNILGIGPWCIWILEPPIVYDLKYRGRPAWSKIKMASAKVGSVELELLEHLDGETIYQDFIAQHGEGLHHLQFLVDDADVTCQTLAEHGFFSLQSGRAGKISYNHIDIKPLRTIWEVASIGSEIPGNPERYPTTEQISPAEIKVSAINQVAIVVRDLRSVAENYWKILGIGAWDIYDWEAPLVYDRRYYGKPAWAREKIAVTKVGGIQLELCQPLEGDSIYQDFLTEHGEGLHHMNFSVDDVDETARILVEQGFQSIQSGRHGPTECRNAFNYVDIKPLCAIWEPTHCDEKNIGGKPTRYPGE
jgi:catechol 2,3-dioxygenase-like lactoylglutathione lyase family enzyme